MDSYRYAHGFTVIELMITLAIAALLFTQVIPNFYHLIQNAQLTSQNNTFVSAMRYARSEAIKRGRRVQVCAREGSQCSRGNQWHRGWLVFVDINHNQQVDEDELLQQFDALASGYTLVSNGSRNFHRMQFLPNGQMRRGTGALPMMTFRLCAPNTREGDVAYKSREIVINAGGRIRVQRGRIGVTRCS